MKKETKLSLMVLSVSLVVCLLIVEVALRLVFPSLAWHAESDNYLGWSTEEYRAFDPEAEPKAEGVTRVLFLGDSFLAGSGISDLSNRFSDLFGARHGNVETASLATGGWGTDQELLALIRKGEAWKPDYVVLAFCPINDLSNNLSNRRKHNMKPYFVLNDQGKAELRDPYGVPVEISREAVSYANTGFRSYVLDIARVWLEKVTSRDIRGLYGVMKTEDRFHLKFRDWKENREELYGLPDTLTWTPQETVCHVAGFIEEDFPLNTYQWKLLGGILERMDQECKSIGAKLIVMMLPVPYKAQDLRFVAGGSLVKKFNTPDGGSFTFRADEPNKRLARLCEEKGLTYWDPTKEFIDYVGKNNLTVEVWPKPLDEHFSEKGHAILADMVDDYFTRQGYLPQAESGQGGAQ